MPLFRRHDDSDVTKGPIISGAPFTDPTLHTDHHGQDDSEDREPIVIAASAKTRFEAEVLVAALHSRGIRAAATHASGHRVLVFESDLEAAQAILAEEGDDAEDDVDIVEDDN